MGEQFISLSNWQNEQTKTTPDIENLESTIDTPG